jgi:serine/threonine protein kinase
MVDTATQEVLSTIEGFKTHKVLGKGFSAVTKLASDAQGNPVALKVFDKTNPAFNSTQFKLLKQEVENAAHLKHPNVVNYISFSEDT